jgi:hypothetical protein
MKKIIYSILFFLITSNVLSQRYYDSNDLKYYIDFSTRNANLKFKEYSIKGPIEDIISFYGNRYTVIMGDSIHWLLGQSDKRNKHISYLILKGEYKEVQRLAKWEYSNEKLNVLESDRLFSGYFKDYFNFVDEEEYLNLISDQQAGEFLNDAGLIRDYRIKIYRNNGTNYYDLDINGLIKINKRGIIIESNLPTLTRFSGKFISELNTNIELIKSGYVAGRIDMKDRAIFSLNIDIEKKVGTLTTLEVKLDSDKNETVSKINTTFIILD